MSGSLDFLLLDSELNDLLLFKLFQLLLLGDEEVFLVSAGLFGHRVQDGGNGLGINDGDGEVSGRLDNLGLKKRRKLELLPTFSSEIFY